MTTGAPATIMIVDDSYDDLELVSAALQRIPGFQFNVQTAGDGVRALERLKSAAADDTMPDLALVDLKMPRMDGRTFAEHVKATPELVGVPVLILSTSSRAEDVRSCYEAGCNAYYQKPLEFHELVSLLEAIVAHWCSQVLLLHTYDDATISHRSGSHLPPM
ncbi:MAG: response regulator [Planctomycetota bacterium]